MGHAETLQPRELGPEPLLLLFDLFFVVPPVVWKDAGMSGKEITVLAFRVYLADTIHTPWRPINVIAGSHGVRPVFEICQFLAEGVCGGIAGSAPYRIAMLSSATTTTTTTTAEIRTVSGHMNRRD